MDDLDRYPLLAAARDGNVDFLIQSQTTQPPDYFLTRSKEDYNMIHVAIIMKQPEFLIKALEILPAETVRTLLSTGEGGWNAFHIAVAHGRFLTVVRLLVDYVKQSFPSTSAPTYSPSKPWLVKKDRDGETPFQSALLLKREDYALELMSLDMELVCNINDRQNQSPLYLAVYQGFEKVAVKILTSGHPYSTGGPNGVSPLAVAPNCTEQVCKLLLDKHPEIIMKHHEFGGSLLHSWATLGKVWPFEFMLNSARRNDFMGLLCKTENLRGENPLHYAAKYCSEETVRITQLLVEAFDDKQVLVSPWKQMNNNQCTPPELALVRKHERLALYYISLDFDEIVIASHKNLLYVAVDNGCDEAAQTILMTLRGHPRFKIVDKKSYQRRNILHAASNCSEETARMLVEKLPWMIMEEDDDRKSPLDVASEKGTAGLIKLLLKKEPSSYKKSAWIEACNKGHTDAIKAFIDHSPDFKRLCIEAQDSPLHHIQLGNYNQYQEFLAIPFIQGCINMQDYDCFTPLHRALRRNDILFAEVLLATNDVSRKTRDRSGNTAIDLLVELCNDEVAWEEMCQRVGITNPRMRMNFVMEGGASIRAAGASSVAEMRGILSVVAALLATITFAAVFALPGGLDQNTGEATLAKKTSFLAFILADTYAMCCSMLVLFFLIWSMVIDNQDRSLILIDRSVLILIQSLYGTLVAFITAVFTVISQKSLWASIVVIIMCVFVAVLAVSANTKFLHKILDNMAPSSAIRRRNDQTRSSEEGIALTTRDGDNS